MAPLESLGLPPITRTQLSQPVPGQEKSDDQNSHGELPRHENRHENHTFKGMTTGKYTAPHLLLTSGTRPTTAASEDSVPLRNWRERRHRRERLEATAWPDLPHASYKSLELGTCTGPEKFPSMVELSSEPADTVEKRQGLPSEEAQKSHMAHQAFQFPSSDKSTFQRVSEPLLRMRPNRSTEGRVRNYLTLSSKQRARPESDFTEISCGKRPCPSKSCFLSPRAACTCEN